MKEKRSIGEGREKNSLYSLQKLSSPKLSERTAFVLPILVIALRISFFLLLFLFLFLMFFLILFYHCIFTYLCHFLYIYSYMCI